MKNVGCQNQTLGHSVSATQCQYTRLMTSYIGIGTPYLSNGSILFMNMSFVTSHKYLQISETVALWILPGIRRKLPPPLPSYTVTLNYSCIWLTQNKDIYVHRWPLDTKICVHPHFGSVSHRQDGNDLDLIDFF